MKTCLIVVDLQKGFINASSDYVVERIERLLDKKTFDLVVASQFCNEKDSPFVQLMHWNRMMDPIEQKIVSAKLEHSADCVLKKDVYSCITPEFMSWIKQQGISKIYFAGVDSDGCVLKSAFDCFDAGIDFSILEDCCASSGGEEIHKMALAVMRRSFGRNRLCKAEDIKHG